MTKDGYVFYCSRCRFDHAGECGTLRQDSVPIEMDILQCACNDTGTVSVLLPTGVLMSYVCPCGAAKPAAQPGPVSVPSVAPPSRTVTQGNSSYQAPVPPGGSQQP